MSDWLDGVPSSGTDTVVVSPTDLRNAVCYAAGQGVAYTSANAANQALIDGWIKSGLREVYFNAGYEWSWMTPLCTITLAADDYEYTLPTDFGGFIDNSLTYPTTAPYPPVVLTSESTIRQARAGYTGTGTPTMAAIRSTLSVDRVATGWELVVFPTPNAVTTLQGRYNLEPAALMDSERIYPIGGAGLGEVIIEACKSKMRMDVMDAPGMSAEYGRLLATAIERDRRLNQPKSLGLMGGPEGRRIIDFEQVTSVYYNGTLTSAL